MTNEEKLAMEITNDLDTMVYDCEGGCVDIYANIERAVLVGIKAGKPKWHDLREDLEDLPKNTGEYWCKCDDGEYCIDYYFGEYFPDYVIAWCEPPKFEE